MFLECTTKRTSPTPNPNVAVTTRSARCVFFFYYYKHFAILLNILHKMLPKSALYSTLKVCHISLTIFLQKPLYFLRVYS